MVFSFVRGTFRVRRLQLIPAVLVGVLLLLGAGDDSARIDRIGHQLMCVCGCNQVLLECNHVGCSYSTRMRDELTAAVTRGDSDNNVLQWFIQTYGTTVLTVPTDHGFNRVAWIMPYLALVLGIGAVVFVAGTWRKRPPGPPQSLSGGNASGPRGRSSGGSSASADSQHDRFLEQARRETEL
jgi:cytochrome c-type biogenesis protein CcmH/NrfF